MALTINRKDEIKTEEFQFIKQKFGEKTNSRALYASVKFLVNHLPLFEAEMDQLHVKFKEAYQQCDMLIDAFKKMSVPGKEILCSNQK